MHIRPKLVPTGPVAVPPPKPDFRPEETTDTIAPALERQWAERTHGHGSSTVGILVERGWHPTEQHDDVLDLADAVMDAGGIPKLLYQGKPVEEQMGQVDALLIPGGRDVTPSLYGADLGPNMDPNEPDKAWDLFEFGAIRYALDHDMPFFGQCRGEQGTNVLMGGTLFQHLPVEHPGAVNHRPPTVTDFASRMEPVHGLKVAPGNNRLRAMVGDYAEVNSIHHQGIKDLAPGLEAIAHSPDGLVEGVQVKGKPYQWAVQFHPESLRYTDGRFQSPYALLVEDGARYHNHELLR